MYALTQYLYALEDPFGVTRTLGEWELCRRSDGRPWFAAGNTAIVFRIRRGGEVRALRCYPPCTKPNGCLMAGDTGI